MGQRSQTETVVAIYQAFLQSHTWKQADLARHVEVSTEALRRVLTELQEKGMPLDRDDADRPHVYWSVPKGWFPGSVLFKKEEVPDLLRQLRRVPSGTGRKRLLDLVLSRLPTGKESATATAVIPRDASEQEEQYLPVVEDSANKRVPLSMRYFTTARGEVGERHASVHRVLLGPPARFLATCHRSGTLKTFRVENIVTARLDDREPFRPAEEAAVDAYQAESLDGFHDGGEPTTFSFVIRNPEARWAKNSLLEGMKVEPVGDGIRVTVHTTALGRLARFVVSLGAAAAPETPALAREVALLAWGASENARAIIDRTPEEPRRSPSR